MAMSVNLQSIKAGAVAGVTKRARLNQPIPCSYMPRLQRKTSMQVRCMAEVNLREIMTADSLTKEDGRKDESTPVTALAPKPKVVTVSTKFSDVLAFSGPVLERINGGLAMIGLVAAIVEELIKGEDVFDPISDDGIPWFVGTSIALSLVSLAALSLVALALIFVVIGGALELVPLFP